MKTKFFMYLALCCVLVFTVGLMAGCKGSDGAAGPQGPNGADTVNINSVSADEMPNFKMTGTITSVSMSAQPVVKFTVTDSLGRGVTGLAVSGYDRNGNPTPAITNYTKLTIAQLLATDPQDSSTNAWKNLVLDSSLLSLPTNTGLTANLVDNGDGSYTYTFANSNITYDPAATTRVAVQISGNVPGITPTLPIANPVNIIYDFVPNGATITNTRNIVSETACNGCHSKLGNTTLDPETGKGFKPGQPGHGGRVTTKYCVMCHTTQMESTNRPVSAPTSTGLLTNPDGSTWLLSNGTNTYAQMEFVTMIHKTHMGDKLTLQDYSINKGHYYPNTIGYPQDIRNCTTCHNGLSDSDNWETKPSQKACGSCHDNVSWASVVPTGFVAHSGGVWDDSACINCHGPNGMYPIAEVHQANYATTHNPGLTGAANFKYVISAATVSTATNIPSVTFQILDNGTPVTLNTNYPTSSTVLTGFTGGPSFLFAYALPEDGFAAPSDWNAKNGSISLQNIFDGTKGQLIDNGNNTYTAVITGGTGTNTLIPTNATMVTGAMYGSFIQSNWSSISSDPTYSARPGIAAMMTATGYTARRDIVSETKCNGCHEQLGTDPYFHGGQRNIAMCAMCHTPNQASNGWSASFRNFYHAIHGASKRTVPFTEDGASPDDNFSMIEYPAFLNDCQKCHLPGTYDFSGAAYTGSVMNNMLLVTAASGTLNGLDRYGNNVLWKYPQDSQGNLLYGLTLGNYGAGYSFDSSGASTDGADTNLVSTPITAVCTACHDSSTWIAHMRENGGSFYDTRADAKNNIINGRGESCLVCHGKGAVADINAAHKY